MSNPATPLTIGSEIWADDRKLSRVFSWLTRIGAAPKFGSRPIGWYQQDQCAAIKGLETCAKFRSIALDATPIRHSNGCFEARVAGRWTAFARIFAYQIVQA